jgi:hypothetical protein
VAAGTSGPDGPGSRLSREDQTSLNWLRMHYENYYRIDYVTPAEETWFWQAVWRRDGEPGTLVADSAIMLRDMMREDQARRRSEARRAGGGRQAWGGS